MAECVKYITYKFQPIANTADIEGEMPTTRKKVITRVLYGFGLCAVDGYIHQHKCVWRCVEGVGVVCVACRSEDRSGWPTKITGRSRRASTTSQLQLCPTGGRYIACIIYAFHS